MSGIDTDGYSARLRERAVDLSGRRLLVTDLRGSAQEGDLTEPVNCDGLGRIRHFTTATSPGWPANPLPACPATAALGTGPPGPLRAQVFQNAACNWRCWYCFVPFGLLSANPTRSRWLTAGQLVDAWLDQADPPNVIDLSGGQPDLVPEWTAWIIEELAGRGLLDRVFVWGDDNLSTDYYFRHLPARQRNLIASCRNYGRVCCFKGFDEESFAFNTAAAPGMFARQFELFRRLAATGMDLYAYATFTTDEPRQIPARIARFCDRLQGITELLPLRMVPLEIQVWGPVVPRMRPSRDRALRLQQEAVEAWNAEMTRRFTTADRALPIHHVPLSVTREPR